MASTHDLLEFRDTLPAEERSCLETRILQSHEALLAEAQGAAEAAEVYLLQLDSIKKMERVKKKTYGKANARGITDAEIADRVLKAQERTPCPAGPSHLYNPGAASLTNPASSPSVLDLPVSTAPARLQELTTGKRKRTITQAYTEAIVGSICHTKRTRVAHYIILVVWLCGGRVWCPPAILDVFTVIYAGFTVISDGYQSNHM